MAGYVSRPRDVIGGLATVAVGIGFLTIGTDLEFGTARQMGPGYFPVVLSLVLIILGVALAIAAWRRSLEEGSIGSIPWRTLALITLPTVFFGVTLRGLGLPLSLFLTLLAVALASRYASIKSALALATTITAFCSLIFIAGLGLPLPVVGSWIQPSNWSGAEAPAEEPTEPSN
jgi:Tripartite tricarboxylate transporter TctB family